MSDRVGMVSLVGAGPGDADLITVRGLRLLRRADVVVYDRLVCVDLLSEINSRAERIDAGKHPEFVRFSQDQINAMLIDRAQRGLDVVRLKGGDPFIFGRGSEEVSACALAGVPCTVIPGVSSAHAVPAAAGIPLTHRGLARSYAVVTARTDPALPAPELPYASLKGIDTLVVLMGRSNLGSIANSLIQAGWEANTLSACIEMGCTADQRTITGDLSNIAARADAAGTKAPVVIVVGDVVGCASDQLLSAVRSEMHAE